MTVRTVAELIGRSRGHRISRPRPGTKTGRVYDLFMTAEYVKRPPDISAKSWNSIKRTLQDFWGMEFHGRNNGKLGGGTKCIGIWDGPYLIPIERIGQ